MEKERVKKVETPAIHSQSTKERVMAEKEEKSRKVRCRFINPSQPGVTVGPFPLRLYPGKIEMYEFKHNEECIVPLYVLEHINNTVGEADFHNIVDEKGRLIPKNVKKSRFQLSVIEYL